jgi:hypothetical protein
MNYDAAIKIPTVKTGNMKNIYDFILNKQKNTL